MAAVMDPAEHLALILLPVVRVEIWNQPNEVALILLC